MSQQKENIEPVYFMDLVVENVRCFKNEQKMDLSDRNGKPARWTIILGDNGTGKTTLLKCLAFLNPIHSDFYNGYVPLGGFNIKYSRSFFNYPSIVSSTKYAKGRFCKNHETEIINEQYSLERKHENTILDFKDTPNFLKDIFMVAYSASRKTGEGSLTEFNNSHSIQNLFLDDNLVNAEAWLLETDFAIKSSEGTIKKRLQSHYQKVNDTLKKLLPDIQDFRVKAITDVNNIQVSMEVKTPYGWVDMKNLSLGYQTFIAWVVDLAARLFDRYPDSDTPLEEPCIVLVDEIDLHLHPKWQRKIVGFLTDIFKNAQFIVTAHSPLIVQAAEDANLVLLKREGDSVQIYNNVEKERIQDWTIDQILTSDLYDLISSRPPKYDNALERKQHILKKKQLTKTDEIELENISKELNDLPLKNEAANEALNALKKAAAILKS